MKCKTFNFNAQFLQSRITQSADFIDYLLIIKGKLFMDFLNSITNKVKDALPDQAEEFLKGQGKDQIIKFITDKVKDGKQSEAKDLVSDTLKKQEDGKLDSGGIQGFVQKISSLVKPEYIDEVKNFVMKFFNKGK